ncbi:MAG: hypothetical protein HUK22_08090 [Thermoguttaceae bacterium]|nr:hypothetical protein [Thermoguttaceae bacterium]
MSEISELIPLLAKALFATIVIEECVALFWKERDAKLALVVLVANILTNPALNLVFYYGADWIYDAPTNERIATIVGESVVFIVETAFFWRFAVKPLPRAAAFAATLNAASYFSSGPLTALGYWD